MAKKRKIKVVIKKLGRDKAVGLAYFGLDLIEVDERQTPREFLGSLGHELGHLHWPSASEAKILAFERDLKRILWMAGYRRIYPDRKKMKN